MQSNGYRWFIAGAMLGAVGTMMGSNMKSGSRKQIKRTKAQAASMVGRMSREAGQMLGMVGESWAQRMR